MMKMSFIVSISQSRTKLEIQDTTENDTAKERRKEENDAEEKGKQTLCDESDGIYLNCSVLLSCNDDRTAGRKRDGEREKEGR